MIEPEAYAAHIHHEEHHPEVETHLVGIQVPANPEDTWITHHSHG